MCGGGASGAERRMGWPLYVILYLIPKFYAQREKMIKQVWDSIDNKLNEHNGDHLEVPFKFWINKMFDLKNIMYPIKSKGQSKYIRSLDNIIIATETGTGLDLANDDADDVDGDE